MSYWTCDKDARCIDCPRNYEEEKCDHWIEVEAIRRGFWEKKPNGRWPSGWWYCSKCGCPAGVLQFDLMEYGKISPQLGERCSCCGAFLSKEEER